MKIVSTILFTVLLSSLVCFTSSQPNQLLQTEFNLFLQRLESVLNSKGYESLPFKLTVDVIQNLKLTSDEFKNLCLQYEAEYVETGEILLSVMALDSTIEYIFDHYKMSVDNYSKIAIDEIQTMDPIGLNIYLTKEKVENASPMFTDFVVLFLRTMHDRLRLIKMKTDDSQFPIFGSDINLQKLPHRIRHEIATEYIDTSLQAINIFTDLVTEITGIKMYRILTDLNVYQTHSPSTTNDVQLLSYTYFHNANNRTRIRVTHHAVCILYKASSQTVHVYDSLMDNRLDDRQLDIIGKLYPYSLGIIFERPKTLQKQQPTCAIFAMTYATMLLLGRDPKNSDVKVNKVHGDESLYMRMHILNMIATRKLSLME